MENEIKAIREKIKSDGGGMVLIIEPPDGSIMTREYVYILMKNKFDWYPEGTRLLVETSLGKIFPTNPSGVTD